MLHVVPAYGRDYQSKAAVVRALAERADFRIADLHSPWDGAYVAVPDIWLEADRVQVRYGALRKVAIVSRREVAKVEATLAPEHVAPLPYAECDYCGRDVPRAELSVEEDDGLAACRECQAVLTGRGDR